MSNKKHPDNKIWVNVFSVHQIYENIYHIAMFGASHFYEKPFNKISKYFIDTFKTPTFYFDVYENIELKERVILDDEIIQPHWDEKILRSFIYSETIGNKKNVRELYIHAVPRLKILAEKTESDFVLGNEAREELLKLKAMMEAAYSPKILPQLKAV